MNLDLLLEEVDCYKEITGQPGLCRSDKNNIARLDELDALVVELRKGTWTIIDDTAHNRKLLKEHIYYDTEWPTGMGKMVMGRKPGSRHIPSSRRYPGASRRQCDTLFLHEQIVEAKPGELVGHRGGRLWDNRACGIVHEGCTLLPSTKHLPDELIWTIWSWQPGYGGCWAQWLMDEGIARVMLDFNWRMPNLIYVLTHGEMEIVQGHWAEVGGKLAENFLTWLSQRCGAGIARFAVMNGAIKGRNAALYDRYGKCFDVEHYILNKTACEVGWSHGTVLDGLEYPLEPDYEFEECYVAAILSGSLDLIADFIRKVEHRVHSSFSTRRILGGYMIGQPIRHIILWTCHRLARSARALRKRKSPANAPKDSGQRVEPGSVIEDCQSVIEAMKSCCANERYVPISLPLIKAVYNEDLAQVKKLMKDMDHANSCLDSIDQYKSVWENSLISADVTREITRIKNGSPKFAPTNMNYRKLLELGTNEMRMAMMETAIPSIIGLGCIPNWVFKELLDKGYPICHRGGGRGVRPDIIWHHSFFPGMDCPPTEPSYWIYDMYSSMCHRNMARGGQVHNGMLFYCVLFDDTDLLNMLHTNTDELTYLKGTIESGEYYAPRCLRAIEEKLIEEED